MENNSSSKPLSIIVYDHHFDKIHYALVMAAAAAAIGQPTTLFFTMGACNALFCDDEEGNAAWSKMPLSDSKKTGRERDDSYRRKGIATFEELINACITFKTKFMICEMGLKAKQLENLVLRKDLKIEPGGAVTFLKKASKNSSILFI